MDDKLKSFYNQLDKNPDFIVAKLLDVPDTIEVFVRNFDISVEEVIKSIKITTSLKVLKQENKRRTLTVSVWNPEDCKKCGTRRSFIEENGKKRYFCNQCIESKAG